MNVAICNGSATMSHCNDDDDNNNDDDDDDDDDVLVLGLVSAKDGRAMISV